MLHYFVLYCIDKCWFISRCDLMYYFVLLYAIWCCFELIYTVLHHCMMWYDMMCCAVFIYAIIYCIIICHFVLSCLVWCHFMLLCVSLHFQIIHISYSVPSLNTLCRKDIINSKILITWYYCQIIIYHI